VNDIRDMENMNPIDGGDTYLTPANMANAQEPAKIARAYLPVLVDAIQRVLRREANDVRGAVQRLLTKRGAEDFTVWMGEFYQEHQDFIVRSLTPAAMGYADQVSGGLDLAAVSERVAESLRLFAIRRAGQMQETFKNALSDVDPAGRIESIINGWDGLYAERIARCEISRQTQVLAMPKEPTWTM
jgi:hypothetical protein